MDPVTLSLGAKALSLGRRYLPHVLAVLFLLAAAWVVRDRIHDAEERASSAERRAATAEASAAQWREASRVQSESILRLADSYKQLSADMGARDARFQAVWRDTLRATGQLEDRAKRLLAIPTAQTPAEACEAAARSLRDARGYGYVVSVDLRTQEEKARGE